MTPERWQRVQEIFHDAAERPVGARAAALDAACAGDQELRAAVDAMLRSDEAVSAFLDSASPSGLLAVAEPEPAPLEGRRVGPYQIVREIGRGGMGAVYLAEREDVGKRVALKVVRGSLAAPEHFERFLFERRVLARLEHPNVARLLDAGVTEDGTPWFAMEYVEGEPIDRFCDARRLTVAERLLLGERVCEAVQYAHRNLVVHRDLKPSNILVAESSASTAVVGEPKLLDFGIAKLLGYGPEAELTGTGMRVMTPDYAAPEQVRGESVTAATDVYALGIVLYELLTGQRPYAARGNSLADIERTVLDTEPTRPSIVVTRWREVLRPDGPAERIAPAALAAARRTTPERLRRELAGDLDTIVLKALEKEPARRYASAEQLLDDLRRYREGRPVLARPHTLGYRSRMFVRRHRVLAASATLLVLLLAGFAGTMAYEQAQTARALRLAEAEAEKARQVTRFLTGMFRDADPFQEGGVGVGRTVSREPLALGAERLERELAGQPEVRAELLHTLGVIDRNLGRYDQAEQLLRRAIDERRRMPGGRDRSDRELASLLHEMGATLRLKSDYAGAEGWLRQAWAMRRTLLTDDHLDVAATLYQLGTVRRYQGQYDEADRFLRQAVAIQQRRPESPALAGSLEELAVVRKIAGDFGSAEQMLRQAIAIRERMTGREHPAVASALTRLAWVLLDAADVAGAERAVRQALDIQRQRLDAGHPAVLSTQSELSLILRRKGEVEAAERLQRDVLDGRRQLHGEYHRDVAGSMHNLSRMLRQRGELAGAEAMLRRSIEIHRTLTGSDEDLSPLLQDLAITQYERGDENGATRLAHRLVGVRSETMWMWDAESAEDLSALASMLHRQGDCERAETLYRRAAAVYTKLYRPSHPSAAHTRSHLAACLTALGRYAEAEPLLVQSHAALRDALGEHDRRTVEARARLDTLRAARPVVGGR